jgi:putative FMN-dependent luciferase-like monooxygenase
MPAKIAIKRLGFFTRLLDETDAAERYRLALAQIQQAERCGYDSAWIAQHHFHEGEGGLPAPFVFLAQAAAHTSRLRLGTGIVTLPLELPIRVAEDAVVLDLMSGQRLEIGVGPGGNLTAFTAFGLDAKDRHRLMEGNLALMRTAWSGGELPGGDRLYPSSPTLVDRIWQATFSVEGARRAGLAGDGLMLSRTQPRLPDRPNAALADIQNPMIDAYLAALPKGREPRILASRPCSWPMTGGSDAARRAGASASASPGRDRKPVLERPGRRPDRRLRHPCRHARRGDRLVAGRRHAQAGDRHDRAEPFDRSAASLHPALHRAGGR